MGLLVTPMARMLLQLADIKTNDLDGSILRAYQNNYTPILTSNAGNFTESTFAGYAAIVLGAWGAPFDNGASQAETDYALQTWLCTAGGQTIFGVYLTKAGVLVCAQRDPAAPITIGAGQTYSVLPRYVVENQ